MRNQTPSYSNWGSYKGLPGLADLGQFAGGGVDDEAADGDVLRDEGMMDDGIDRLPDGGFRVVETFQPGVQVDVFPLQAGLLDPPFQHLLPEMGETHVAGAAGGMGDDHDLPDTQFIHGDDEAPHRGIPGRGNHRPGVLDDLGVPVPESEGVLQEDGQARVHATEHRQFLVGILVGQMGLVLSCRHVFAVEGQDGIDLCHTANVRIIH